MKLTQTTKRTAGMTLLELTVVILVLLSLISILFVGARAWKKGSDRAANILNIRNVQQAVRGHMNMNEIETPEAKGDGVAIDDADIVGDKGYMKMPADFAGITYDTLKKAPAIGELYLDASGDGATDGTLGPKATQVADW